ncbi:MAG: carbamoyltransferase HypF [Propionivibrio sp.]|nr:carbamoyltransferase HypF [Propionivibrio sp.]
MTGNAVIACRIRVTGIVQGVGFRPFVWHLAQELELNGWVRNDSEGVEIAAEGAQAQVDALLQRLRSEAPPLARVDAVNAVDAVPNGLAGFAIAESAGRELSTTRTAIGPDVAVCADCLAELFDPPGRRWRHAFITCTHCGPRYTVTRTLPYDRPQTSLAPFPLCPACAIEYGTPADRRFHAETTCCPVCGPRLSLTDLQGNAIAGDPIAATLQLLHSGSIVAIKGLGGFHLACDARNAATVARLRWRKNREEKPFAVMAANVASLAQYAKCAVQEQALLESRERPVVLLQAQSGCDAALTGVAPGLNQMGVMLPSTPMHFLLFHEAAGRPAGCQWLAAPQDLLLVMTSANPGGEPIVCNSVEARTRLADIADAILDHDREIVARCDDSVVRVVDQKLQFIRRSRGYASDAIRLPRAGPSLLAFGAHLKSSVCLTRGNEAYLSPHIGDLDNAATCVFFDGTVSRMLHLLEITPEIVAHDLHPDYFSTRAAIDFADRHGLPRIAVAHHHAHIAAVCAEHGRCSPVLGLALDGVGLGPDGEAWGGELLHLNGASCGRLGHLRPLPLPGGDRAAREPWRMVAAVLHEQGRNAEIGMRLREAGADLVADMLQRQLNCPRTSSMGRVFDAAAGMLGLCSVMKYEAQAAILIEQAASRHIEKHGWPQALQSGWTISGGGQLDLLPVLASLDGAEDAELAAARFHATLVAALAEWVGQAAESTDLKVLACAGGCFHNALLTAGLTKTLEQRGIIVLVPERVSPGDAGVALGQAWVAIQTLQTLES